MTFNPLSVARQIIAETSLTDPDDIAAQIYDRTPKKALAETYKGLLRHTAREAIRTANMDASTPPPVRTEPNRSSRVAAIRSTHISYFDQRVFAAGEWKLLRNCSHSDVLDLAAQRHDAARRNSAKAAEFEALADRMKRAGVEFAGQLEQEAAA